MSGRVHSVIKSQCHKIITRKLLRNQTMTSCDLHSAVGAS